MALLTALLTLTTGSTFGGEINVLGYFGVKIPDNSFDASGSNGSFLGIADSRDSPPITRTFTIQNTDSILETLELTGSGTQLVEIQGEHASDFSVTQQPPVSTIFGGFSTTFQVTFTPGAGGIRDAILIIPNDDSNENPYNFAIEAVVSRFGVDYSAGTGGTLSGNVRQNVLSTRNASEIIVHPSPGNYFAGWSDGVTTNPRQDLNVSRDISVTAAYLSYTSNGSEVTITDCDWFLPGSFDVPASIDGLPVTGIGDAAFSGCNRLTNVTIPPSVTSIGSEAFFGCSRLREINFAGTAPSFAGAAFSGLPAGATITASDPYASGFAYGTTVDGIPITGLSPLSFTITAAEVAITACNPLAEGEFIVPSLINGLPVTSIESGAFSGCNRLEILTIPSGITSIGDAVFEDCSELWSITLPVGIMSIGSEAFRGCHSLVDITIPSSVTSIGPRAFFECLSLIVLTIPSGVTSIGESAFETCYSLESITIPGGVTRINDSTFSECHSLTNVTLPSGIISIGDSAFLGCLNLASITIPASVASIGDLAFLGCWELDELIFTGNAPMIEDGLLHLPSEDALITIADPHATGFTYGEPFGGVPITGLSPLSFTIIGPGVEITACSIRVEGEVRIPSSFDGLPVTSIGPAAFLECIDATSIIIPEGVTEILELAFSGCSSLESVAIPSSVNRIGVFSFQGCRNLMSVTVPDGVSGLEEGIFSGCSNLTNVVLPESVIVISNRVFHQCSSLTSVVIPREVSWVGEAAFSGCTSLTGFLVDPDNASYQGAGAVLLSKDGTGLIAFPGANGHYTVPSSISSIGPGAFQDCGDLTSITIPETVTSIGSSAFQSCRNLTDIIIPDGITSIEDSTFYECSNLTGVAMPNSVRNIGYRAFGECQSLTNVTIPSGVTRIRNSAFSNCSGLLSITIPSGVTGIENGTFFGCSSLASVTIPSSVTNIWSWAFAGCRSLLSVTIPPGVTSIQNNTFFNCSNLASVTIPSGLTSIKTRAFRGCSSLLSVTIPSGVTHIENESFLGCSSLTSVTISPGVTNIGDWAFYSCSALTNITIPASVTRIGYRAFGGCALLTKITLSGMAPELGPSAFFNVPPNASICVSDPAATGFIYGGTFAGLPVTGLDPNADPYGTGVSNLLTYAFFGPDRDPATVQPSDLPQASLAGGSLSIAFNDPGVADVSYGAEWSSTLDGDWEDLPDSDADPDRFQFSVPADTARKFLRLTIIEN